MPESYAFGPYQLDLSRRVLLRDDATVALSHKALELLRVLISRPGELVTKDELITSVWHGEPISDANLTQHVFMLRKALQERSRDHLYIATVPGEGYRFVAPVRPGGGSRIRDAFKNPEAYHAYVKGRYCNEKRSEGAFWDALACFKRAAELEPAFAPAQVGIAQANFLLAAYQYVPPHLGYNDARKAAERALQLDRTVNDAETLLGAISLFFDWDFDMAEDFLRRALERSPLDVEALANRTWLSIARVRLEQALMDAEAALTADPSSLHLQATLGLVYQYLGRVDHAVQHFRALLDMDSDFNLARYYLGSALVQRGDLDEGVQALEVAARLEQSAQAYSSLGYAYAVSGRPAEARAILDRLRVMSGQRYVSSYSVAVPLVGLGRYDEAVATLQAAYAERATWMIFLGVESRFDPLRSDPRFREILRRVGIRSAA